MGIASTSFLGARLGKQTALNGGNQTPGSGAPSTLSLPSTGEDSLLLLERCHALGAAGIQCVIQGDPRQLRARAEELGMWIEAMISVRVSTLEQLEESIVAAKEAGSTVARDGLLGGRRYESFNGLADWNAWVKLSLEKLEVAVPVFEKHQLTLALENHKDWTLDEYVNLFEQYSSEYFGACLDFGNNLSLLDDPMETISAVAPYAKATHLKDIALSPDSDGFLLSEVPLGQGVLDLAQAVEILRAANPKIRFSLEMITRDPLKVPCLTDRYWVTFPRRNGLHLARTLRFVQSHASQLPLARPEELDSERHAQIELANIKSCFEYLQGTQKGVS